MSLDTHDHVVDDWYALDVEPKLNHKIDQLQQIITEQSSLLKTLSAEIQFLKSELQVKHAEQQLKQDRSSQQKDRMNQLLDELKVLKQRELNMLIREKIPCPFFPIPSTVFQKPL